jgi:hypothetical protein
MSKAQIEDHILLIGSEQTGTSVTVVNAVYLDNARRIKGIRAMAIKYSAVMDALEGVGQ